MCQRPLFTGMVGNVIPKVGDRVDLQQLLDRHVREIASRAVRLFFGGCEVADRLVTQPDGTSAAGFGHSSSPFFEPAANGPRRLPRSRTEFNGGGFCLLSAPVKP